MPVHTQHPLYTKQLIKWDILRKIVDNDARSLIPDVDVNDQVRSNKYRNDGILTNFTKLTRDGLVGLVFKKDPEVTLPPELDYILDDATGSNIDLIQLLQQSVSEVLMKGRCGLLAEVPAVDPDSKTDERLSHIRIYSAENIINWHYGMKHNMQQLDMVVLKEQIEVNDPAVDKFHWLYREQYRVLSLDEFGEYVQEIWDYENNPVSIIKPLDYKGNPFRELPFIFVGSENNDANIDPVPLYDIAAVNLGHYKNSCDYEESISICGQPTVFLSTEVGQEEFKLAYPSGIKFGVRAGYNLGPGGNAMLLQANPNQLVATAMLEKQTQMVSIGARLISESGGRETAEAARIRYGAQNSALHVVTYNASDAWTRLLNFVMIFMMETPTEANVSLNTHYYDDAADPLLIAQQIMLLDRGVIGMSDIRDSLRNVGVIKEDRTEEQIDNEALTADPLAGAVIPSEV